MNVTFAALLRSLVRLQCFNLTLNLMWCQPLMAYIFTDVGLGVPMPPITSIIGCKSKLIHYQSLANSQHDSAGYNSPPDVDTDQAPSLTLWSEQVYATPPAPEAHPPSSSSSSSSSSSASSPTSSVGRSRWPWQGLVGVMWLVPSRLVPSCSRLMCRTTAVALNACCRGGQRWQVGTRWWERLHFAH